MQKRTFETLMRSAGVKGHEGDRLEQRGKEKKAIFDKRYCGASGK